MSTPASSASQSPWLKDLWYFVATSRELKANRQFRRIILGEPIALGRGADGQAFALRDICPHRAVPLSAGRQVETDGRVTLECPYHGWRFGVADGVCRHIPSLVPGQPYEAERIKVRRYPVHEANGLVFAYIAEDARREASPVLPPPAFDAPGEPKFVVERIFKAHMDDAVVGLMDPAHVPFVHSQWWWRPPSTGFKIKQKPFEPRAKGWAIARHAPSGNSLAYRALFGGAVTTEIVFEIPGYRWEVVENARSRLFTLTCLTPETEKATRITQITYWSGAPLLDLLKPILIPAAAEFLDQDGRMVDLQNQGLAFGPKMLWIDDIDVQAKWYHKLKREWLAARTEGRDFANPIEPATLSWRS